MRSIHYKKTHAYLYRSINIDYEYWIRKGLIPIGTKEPVDWYDGIIPDDQIITIPFEAVSKPFNSRSAFNILLLGGSGDGKSLLIKLIWYVLHKAGYFCCLFDPKSTESGRARKAWIDSSRLPPLMFPEGIKLSHYMPYFVARNFKHMAHNFRISAMDLSNFTEVEMWQGLGASGRGASIIARTVKKMRDRDPSFSIAQLGDQIHLLNKNTPKEGGALFNQMSAQTFENVMRCFTDIDDWGFVNDEYEDIDLWEEWKKGNSVCISYNSSAKKFMTFDIGFRIQQASRYYAERGNQTPIMFFCDDASYYADRFETVKFNYALQEIQYIGNNYRALGLNNLLAVQSLNIIDESIAETYKIKIISPMFQHVDSLQKINIPFDAIDMLRHDELVKDKDNYVFQWLLVNQNNDVIPFFPFTPPCNHFQEVYSPLNQEEIQNAEY